VSEASASSVSSPSIRLHRSRMRNGCPMKSSGRVRFKEKRVKPKARNLPGQSAKPPTLPKDSTSSSTGPGGRGVIDSLGQARACGFACHSRDDVRWIGVRKSAPHAQREKLCLQNCGRVRQRCHQTNGGQRPTGTDADRANAADSRANWAALQVGCAADRFATGAGGQRSGGQSHERFSPAGTGTPRVPRPNASLIVHRNQTTEYRSCEQCSSPEKAKQNYDERKGEC
jgi:hypothetical protein